MGKKTMIEPKEQDLTAENHQRELVGAQPFYKFKTKITTSTN